MRARALAMITVASLVALLLAALIGASYLPVRRALRVNPVDVLRSE